MYYNCIVPRECIGVFTHNNGYKKNTYTYLLLLFGNNVVYFRFHLFFLNSMITFIAYSGVY